MSASHEGNRHRDPPASRPSVEADPDPTLAALQDLLAATEQMTQATALIQDRAQVIRAYRREGLSYREIVAREDRPLIAEVFTDAIGRFEAAGTRFRQAEALALHREGMTLAEIGALFGLTRQRISGFVREARMRSADRK